MMTSNESEMEEDTSVAMSGYPDATAARRQWNTVPVVVMMEKKNETGCLKCC